MTDGLDAVAAVVALSITVEFVLVPVTVELVFVPVTVELTVLDDELTVFELEETVLDEELTVLPTVVLVVTVSVAKAIDTQKPPRITTVRSRPRSADFFYTWSLFFLAIAVRNVALILDYNTFPCNAYGIFFRHVVLLVTLLFHNFAFAGRLYAGLHDTFLGLNPVSS